MIETLIEMAIRTIKHDSEYRFRSSYSGRELANILLIRICQLTRGSFVAIRFKVAGLPLFCGKRVTVRYAYLVRSGPGLILEDGVTLDALSEKGILFGRNVTVGRCAILACTGVVASRGIGISIGDNSAVGAQSFLGGQGGIVIGKDVIMGPGVRIYSEDHTYSGRSTVIRKQGETRIGVVIEDNCWIGSGVTIVDGVTIRSGSVVAAGAVVIKEVPSNSVVAGVPAHHVKSRIP